MQRGEVWWVQFDERRLVVLLSGDDSSGIRVMQVVAPAGVDISGLGIEVTVGTGEGLPFEGVLRLAFPRPGFTPCTWLTTVSRDDLIERAAVLSPQKLSEIDDALRLNELGWTADAVRGHWSGGRTGRWRGYLTAARGFLGSAGVRHGADRHKRTGG
ncbi:type II toxin-antitoxin system PemK/MazF family toxin [Streptomyces sp. NPDC048002]|uniref:type II toxin-antitoxin system PemK/MazF family toxin n=2 Tax=Streptomyces TaxID=1883 RepID=UPI003401ABEC